MRFSHMNLRKSFYSCYYLFIAVAVLSACDQVGAAKEKISSLLGGGLKTGEVYRALDGDTIRVVSKDEVEDEHGTVGKYTVEGDQVRVVLGGVMASYYRITEDGLQKDGQNNTLYSSVKYEKVS